VRLRRAQTLDAARKAALEQGGIEGGQHPIQGVVAGDAMLEGQEAAQEGELLFAPELNRAGGG
jgi:hypothetical protein